MEIQMNQMSRKWHRRLKHDSKIEMHHLQKEDEQVLQDALKDSLT